MRAVIYARFSSEKQNEASIEGQLRECLDYAKYNGIEVIGEYIDRAVSAKTDNRPDFQRMIKDSYKNAFDTVLVWKLDRFARNRYDSAYYKNILKKNGVRVISAKESISQGADGILLESILEGYAEYYSAELSEKVRRGMTENALKARSNGVRAPFGYYVDENDQYQIDEGKAPIVKEIFTLYADGKKITEIVEIMKARGVQNRGYTMNYNAIFRILTNRKYIGEYKFGDVVIPNGMPAIVDEDIFNKIQARMKRNKKAPAMHRSEDDVIEELADRIFDLQNSETHASVSIQAQIAEVDKKLNNLIEAMAQGIFSQATKKVLDDLEEQKKNLEIELFRTEVKNPLLTKEQILFSLYNYRKLDLTTTNGRQRLIDGFVNSIYLYDDHFIITFNYKNQSKTVSFDEVNSSSLTSTGSPDGVVTILLQHFFVFVKILPKDMPIIIKTYSELQRRKKGARRLSPRVPFLYF